MKFNGVDEIEVNNIKMLRLTLNELPYMEVDYSSQQRFNSIGVKSN